MARIQRVIRMTSLLLNRRVGVHSWLKGMLTHQVAVSARGGGMVFCDASDERAYFADKARK